MNSEQSFGQLVKARRRELGLTQDELARRVGCAPVTIRKIEYDDLRPSVQIAERLAMALNIALEERAAFVRLARLERAPLVEPTPTPAPSPEEIGTEDLTGRAIRGYALGERIGAGGMGAVYRAVQPLVEREVAVKIILPQYANHPDFIRRFEAEAQLVARLEHPHIVPLYDYWREPNVAFLVMRLLRGGSVRNLLEKDVLPIEMTLHIVEQVGSALGAAHRVGVIHRDLKPANILLDEDHNAYLADFGIAKNLGNPNLEDQTQFDAVVGSPQYISPEQIRSEFVRPQTDIYCLGVVLYELLTGHLPFYGPTPIEIMHQHLSAPLPPLAARRTGLPGGLDAVIERATAKDPLERYPDVESMLAELRRAVQSDFPIVKPLPTAVELPPLTAADNPYKGLRAFGEGDTADFFGRESLTQQLLVRLGEGGDLSRFLAVVGPSGSGKSSVAGAGLVPALRRGALPGSDHWFIVEMMPGAHPLEELEAALLRIAVNPPATLLSQLREDKRGLLRAVRRCLPDDPAIELVIVIDQFEEAFTLVRDESVRAHLLDSLVTAVLDERSRVRIVLTLRADFTDRPLRYVDFGELVRQRSEFVLPLTPEELERAIIAPADRVGLTLEPGLAAAILRDVNDQPGALPLLQYALTELFDKREGRTLTRAAYRSIGGVQGALGRRTEEVFIGLDEVGQEAARQLFLRLVTLGEGVEDTRRRVLREELLSVDGQRMAFGIADVTDNAAQANPLPPLQNLLPMDRVIDTFGKHRLLSFDRDPVTRGPTVEVAHEALLREWPRLREWLNQSRAEVRMQRLLAGETAEWIAANRDSSFLLTGAHLEQFEGWAAATTVSLTQDERAYLDASIAEGERKQMEELTRQRRELELTRKSEAAQRTSANRLRYLVGALTIFLLVAIGLSAFAFNQQNRATEQARLATARELAGAAVNNLNVDPERSILLALQAVTTTYSIDKKPLPEAEEALHRAMSVPRPLLVLHHDGGVSTVAYSPDGTRLATVTGDGAAKVWDAATGQEMFALNEASGGDHGDHGGHDDHGNEATGTNAGQVEELISSLAFSPDGTRLATGNRDGVAKVWDAATGKALLTLNQTGHTTPTVISAVAFSPDGTHLATATEDGTVQIYEATTGQALLTLSSHLAKYLSSEPNIHRNDVAFSPDGTRLATEGPDYTVKVWDAASGRELLTLAGQTDQILDISFSPDGERLATVAYGGAAKIWDAMTGQELLTLSGHTGAVHSVVFSPDGLRLATASTDNTAKVWDAATGQELFSLSGHNGAVKDVAFSPDGTRLATASDDATARVWEAAPSREWATLSGHTNIIERVAYSPDGTRLATASDDATTKIWDAATGQELMTLSGHTGPVYRVTYSSDGTRLATASEDKTAKVWDATTGQELLTLSGHTERVWDVAFSPDATRLATVSDDKTVRLWDAATGKETLMLSGFPSAAHCLAFSPDGKRLVTGGNDGIIWDLTIGQEAFRLALPTNFVTDVVYSPDGTRLFTSDATETAKVWDAKTGELLMTLTGHAGGVWGLAWSPDGSRLATGSTDKTTKIWDAVTGQPVLTLYGHTNLVWSLVFSPDGTRLATGSQDKTARIYVLPIEELVALAQSRVMRSLTIEECQKYLHGPCPTPP